ncbi:MAG: CoA pyrophosphatase [Propionibacteriaceae bacterium]|nr:CoA pyrophosphatase [Propionibacteriaceae bacterium]
MSQLDSLRAALDGGAITRLGQFGRAPGDTRQAAVLMLLSDEPDPCVLFTERAGGLRSHPGQISFPGGGAEPGEAPAETALREAHEEVGLDAGLVTVLGTLPTAWVPVSGYEVTPVVGSWAQAEPLRPVNSGEVADVLQLRVSELSAPEHRVVATIPGDYRGPGFRLGDWFIWGMTAHLLDVLLRVAGWERSWEPRETPVPQRFLRD